MSASSSSFWKSIAIFLLFVLLGVYVLYEWYDDQLYAQIAEKDALIDQARQDAKDIESRRLQAEEIQAAIRAEISELRRQYQDEKVKLEAQIATDVETETKLESALAALKSSHAAELAAEQEKTAAAVAEKDRLTAQLAELQASYEEAKTHAAALQTDLSKVQQAISDSAAEHRKQIAELERHLNERVELARTTPMDETLLRTAQEVGVLPGSDMHAEDRQALLQQMQAVKSQLEVLQGDYESARSQLADVQDQLRQSQAEVADSKAALEAAAAAAPAEDPSAEQAAARAAEMEERLAAEAQVREALQQQHEAAIAALTESLNEAKVALTEARDELAQAKASTESAAQASSTQLDDSQGRISALEAELTQAKAAADEQQAALQADVAALQSQLAEAQARQAQPVEGDSSDAAEQTGAEESLAQAKALIQRLEEQLDAARQDADAAASAQTELEQMRQLRAGFAALNGTYTDRGLLLRLAEDELRFAPGQAALPGGELASLDRIAALLAKRPDLGVRIEGHTDSSGSEDLNRKLSEERARSVQQALVERGVSADRVEAQGLGADRPIASNATAQGRSSNRRVEVYIIEP